MNILAISGSLKSTSTNTYILRAMEGLFPDHVLFSVFENLAMMPHFNPEDDSGNDAVHDFRKQLKRADAVIISTPEYAFGVPGVLKNALDWIVSSGELNAKPVAVISASPLSSGGNKALASLLWTMDALGTRMDENSSLSIPLIKKKMNAEGEITDAVTIASLQSLASHLTEMVNTPYTTQERS